MSRRLKKLIEEKAWETLTEHGYNDSQLFEQLKQKVMEKLDEGAESVDEQKFSAKASVSPSVSPRPAPKPTLPPGANPRDYPYPLGTGPNPSMLPGGGGRKVRDQPPIYQDNKDGQLYVWTMGPPPGWSRTGATQTSQI
jgi:hypothetical protein